MPQPLSPTLRLLFKSVPVGISGALRVYIAFLLIGLSPLLLPCIASGLIIYSTYSLDRCVPCAEDEINQKNLIGANRRMAITGTIFAYLIGIMLLFQEGLFIAPLFPLVIGYLYTKGIRFGSYSFKLKGGAGIKNMVIGLTWGGYIAMVVAHWTPNPLLTAPIFMFFGLKLFINSTLFDLKDIAGDLSVGIRTIPAYLGERGSKYLLVFLSLILHLLMIALVWGGYMRPEITILTYSFLIGAPFIYFYSTEWEVCAHGIKKNLRQIAIQSESGIALALRFIMGVGPGVIVLSNG